MASHATSERSGLLRLVLAQALAVPCLVLAACGGGGGGGSASSPTAGQAGAVGSGVPVTAATADPGTAPGTDPGANPAVPTATDPGGVVVPDTVPPTADFLTRPPALFKAESLVVGFSEPMDPSSLVLTGDLAAAATPGWNARSDTLTLTPGPAGWPLGSSLRITLEARDKAGNALAPLRAEFRVRLDLRNNQPALAVIGQTDFSGVYGNQPFPPGVPTASNLVYPTGNPFLSPQGRLVVPDSGNNRLLVFDGVPAASGASAVAVVGQPDFSSDAYLVDAAHRLGPRGMAAWGDRFIVSEYLADRVAIYPDSPLGGIPTLPTVVLGLPTFGTDTRLLINAPTCDATRLLRPTGVAVTPDGRLLVVDSGHHRVLIWNRVPTLSGTPADHVLGQPGMSTCDPNATATSGGASAVSARSLNAPVGLWTDGTRLVVVDAGNHRVLIWNSFPQASFAPADLVLGQPDFTANNNSLSPSATTVARNPGTGSLYGEVASNGIQLAIADTMDHRVLLWNNFPSRNAQPADVVLGQASFTESAARQESASSLYIPRGVLFSADGLLVTNGQRVSIFKSN